MKSVARHAIVVLAVLALLVAGQPAPGDEQPAQVPLSSIPHPTELWLMPEDNGWDDLLAAIELLPPESPEIDSSSGVARATCHRSSSERPLLPLSQLWPGLTWP